MSLVAFAFMGGGSVGTILAGRVIDAGGFGVYLMAWGLGLVLLGALGRLALAGYRGFRPEPTAGPSKLDTRKAAPERV